MKELGKYFLHHPSKVIVASAALLGASIGGALCGVAAYKFLNRTGIGTTVDDALSVQR